MFGSKKTQCPACRGTLPAKKQDIKSCPRCGIRFDRKAKISVKTKSKTPQQDAEAPEMPQQNAEAPEVPQQDAEAPEVPQQNAEAPEVPQQDAEAPEVPQQDAEVPEMPQQNAEVPEVPQQDAEVPEVPQQDAEPTVTGTVTESVAKILQYESANEMAARNLPKEKIAPNAVDSKHSRAVGFRIGFYTIFVLLCTLFAAYLFQDNLRVSAPFLAPYLDMLVENVELARRKFEDIVALVFAKIGMF